MADNVELNAGSGGDSIAADEISGVKHQRVKVQYGPDGSATDVSLAAPLPIRDFFLEVAKGNVTGHFIVNKFGRNSDIDTAAEETIWANGGMYTFPTAAQTLDVVSSDANDTSAGTGARTVEIQGLDGSYDAVTETVTMTGTTPATTTATFLRVNRAMVKTAGSGGVNAGAITIDQTTSGISVVRA